MLIKKELSKENVINVIDFLLDNTVITSMEDGVGFFTLVAHGSQEELANTICLEINAEREDIAIKKETYDYSYDYSEVKYGWFIYAS